VSLFPGPVSFLFCPARVFGHLRRVQESDNRNRLVRGKIKKEKDHSSLLCALLSCSAHSRSCLQASVNVLNIYHVVALGQHTRTLYCRKGRKEHASLPVAPKRKERIEKEMAGNQQSLPFFILLLIKKWIHWWSLAIWILMKEYFQKKRKGKRRWISRPTLSQKPRRLWSVKKKAI
jgi:hypothetical protein